MFEINTKFDIGDTIWLIDSNKVMSMKITGVKVQVNERCECEVEYDLHHGDRKVEESKAFATKEELLESL